jgi:hypothetical protein
MNAIISSVMKSQSSTMMHRQFKLAIRRADPIKIQRDLQKIIPLIPTSFKTCTFIDITPRHLQQSNSMYSLRIYAWTPGSSINWHNHPYKMCTTTVLRGEIVELCRKDFTSHRIRQKILKPDGTCTRISDLIGIHSVHNVQTVPAYSLQLCTAGAVAPADPRCDARSERAKN